MKRKLTITTEILPMPNSPKEDRFIVQIQYIQAGAIFTDNNHGHGYTLKTAQDLAFKMHSEITRD